MTPSKLEESIKKFTAAIWEQSFDQKQKIYLACHAFAAAIREEGREKCCMHGQYCPQPPTWESATEATMKPREPKECGCGCKKTEFGCCKCLCHELKKPPEPKCVCYPEDVSQHGHCHCHCHCQSELPKEVRDEIGRIADALAVSKAGSPVDRFFNIAKTLTDLCLLCLGIAERGK